MHRTGLRLVKIYTVANDLYKGFYFENEVGQSKQRENSKHYINYISINGVTLDSNFLHGGIVTTEIL